MADCIAHETENTENQPNEANCGDVTETVKKPEVTETSAVAESDGADNKEDEASDDADGDTASRKRKSEAGVVPDDDEEESKKAKTDDEVPPTNGSEVESKDKPDVTTKTVEDVQRLTNDDGEAVA